MLPVIKVDADKMIFKEGDYDRKMYIVLEGRVSVFVIRQKKEVELSVIERFGFFGEAEMHRQRPRTVCAKTLEPSRLVVIKTRMQLEQFAAQNPEFYGKMTRVMTEKLTDINLALA